MWQNILSLRLWVFSDIFFPISGCLKRSETWFPPQTTWFFLSQPVSSSFSSNIFLEVVILTPRSPIGLVIAVDSEISFSKETGYYKTAIGLYFAPNSTHNFSKLIDRKGVDNPDDPPPYTDVKEQTEGNAGVSGILAGVDVIVASKLSVSKLVIKTHSTIFVKGMTENWHPNAGVYARQAYFIEAQKAMDMAAAQGIEVVFWLVGFDRNSEAFALAKAALYAR